MTREEVMHKLGNALRAYYGTWGSPMQEAAIMRVQRWHRRAQLRGMIPEHVSVRILLAKSLLPLPRRYVLP